MQVTDTTILATMYEHAGDYDQPWDPDVHFVVSKDFFKTHVTGERIGSGDRPIGLVCLN